MFLLLVDFGSPPSDQSGLAPPPPRSSVCSPTQISLCSDSSTGPQIGHALDREEVLCLPSRVLSEQEYLHADFWIPTARSVRTRPPPPSFLCLLPYSDPGSSPQLSCPSARSSFSPRCFAALIGFSCSRYSTCIQYLQLLQPRRTFVSTQCAGRVPGQGGGRRRQARGDLWGAVWSGDLSALDTQLGGNQCPVTVSESQISGLRAQTLSCPTWWTHRG